MLIGVRCGQSWPRKIEQNEVPVRPLPDMRESGPACPSLREPKRRVRSLGSRVSDAPRASRMSTALTAAARRLAPRRRPNSPSAIGGRRASTAGRVARRHGGSPPPRLCPAPLRESTRDDEGSDRRRRTIVRRRSRRPSCARRTVRRVARTKERERDRQVTPSERRMRRA